MKRKNEKKPEPANAGLPGSGGATGKSRSPAAGCGQAGNCAKMREAAETAFDKLVLCDYINPYTARVVLGVVRKLNAALSEPPRNCDVGTVEEQAERFHSFCKSNKKCGDVYSCERCPFNSVEDCELAWAQMPYEEGGTK